MCYEDEIFKASASILAERAVFRSAAKLSLSQIGRLTVESVEADTTTPLPSTQTIITLMTGAQLRSTLIIAIPNAYSFCNLNI